MFWNESDLVLCYVGQTVQNKWVGFCVLLMNETVVLFEIRNKITDFGFFRFGPSI